jgi:hypothetical protein
VILTSLLVSVPVLATVTIPDSGPYIVSYQAFENTYVLGDVLIQLEYNIPYAVLPSNTATVNFLIRYKNPSGTILQTVAPFAYQSLGYNYGAVYFYWPAAGGADQPTWGEAGTVELLGNPTVSWSAATPYVSAPMMSTNWSASTTVVQGRGQVCSAVLSLAVDLENRWNVSLTSQAAIGTVLNTTYGQQYFSNIMPYFTTICSSILTTSGAQTVNPPSTTTQNLTYQQSLLQQWINSILGPSITAAATSQGISTDLWLFGVFMIISVITLGYLAAKTESPQSVPLMFIPIFVGGIKIGVVSMDIGVAACAILFIASMYLLIPRRVAV